MEFPPPSFEKLREFLILQRQGEIDLDIGKKSLNALVKMLDNPDFVAVSNIVTLADKMDISPASITRLARLLGYKGFNSFQKIFKQRSKIPIDYYSKKAKELASGKGFSCKSVLKKQLDSTVQNIQYCLDYVADEDIHSVVKLLARSRRVFVFGHKQSSAMSGVLMYGLCLLRQEVQNLGPNEHGIALAIGQLKKNDLVVIFGSSPYSNLTVDLAAMTDSLDCKTIVITDSVLSPLNDHATLSIHVPTNGQYYSNSLAASFIFIESLLSLTAIELGSLAITKLQSHEKLVTRLNSNS